MTGVARTFYILVLETGRKVAVARSTAGQWDGQFRRNWNDGKGRIFGQGLGHLGWDVSFFVGYDRNRRGSPQAGASLLHTHTELICYIGLESQTQKSNSHPRQNPETLLLVPILPR
jgi:hypothetical protein